MIHLIDHTLTMRNIGPKVKFQNNISERGCMALALSLGPSIGLGVKHSDIEKKFLKLMSNDKDFRSSLVDSNGMCKDVLRKTLVISKMSSKRKVKYNDKTYDYNDVVNMSRIIHIADKRNVSKHFVMIIPFFEKERYVVYDPALPFLIEDLRGLFRYYKLTSNREFRNMRWYPFNA